VLCSGETLTDSESEAEDETRPLLRPGSYGTQGGTFSTTPDASFSLTNFNFSLWHRLLSN